MVAVGWWRGRVIDVVGGAGGFGYDPYFEDLQPGMTGAEMQLVQKNETSHRGHAMRALIARLLEERQ